MEHGDEPVVKCPFNDGTYSCECVLQEREIKAVISYLEIVNWVENIMFSNIICVFAWQIVPTALFEKYLKRSVKCAENQTPNSYHCKTPDCVGWCEFDDNVNTFDCPVCTKANCITCRAIHEGMDCKRYQAKLELDSMTDKDAKKTREMFEVRSITDGFLIKVASSNFLPYYVSLSHHAFLEYDQKGGSNALPKV